MLQDNKGNKKLICYYAHCILIYNTQEEVDDLFLLNEMGFEIINPNNPEIEEGYKKDDNIDRMAYFKQFIDKCDIIIFKSFNNQITSGVAYEIEYAAKIGKPILEISIFNNLKPRILDYVQTRELIKKYHV